tara:strand:- start:238 stop:1401 length:1164 start_codon:yes stop_codon:yes gene_type:complete
MLSSNISFQNFKRKFNKRNLNKKLQILLNIKNTVLDSLSQNYKDNYTQKKISKLSKFQNFIIIGMGGSILGIKSIFNFLKGKIRKNFIFIDNFQSNIQYIDRKKNYLKIIISKSGNTLETIANSNILIKKDKKNIFITENKDSYLLNLAKKLKADIIHHNNYIGGRYSVLSEVGMLPAQLMGLNPKKFRKFNQVIKNKNFINNLILNVLNIFYLSKKKKSNSIILNYDENSTDLFYWYQQLVAESLGKKNKGILPIISNMPKDNHSLMQLYLDGQKNNFYTFFFVDSVRSNRINNSKVLNTFNHLKNKSFKKILKSQFYATQNVFKRKNMPFRSFLIKNRSEETLGELFTFFILETILLGKLMKLNPYNQPAVELIKTETNRIIKKS